MFVLTTFTHLLTMYPSRSLVYKSGITKTNVQDKKDEVE